MQLYFIRHGQSANNALYDRTGSWQGRSYDPELTDIGKQQAEYLARFLRQTNPGAATSDWDPHNVSGFGITHLYTSLMIRAVQTGSIVAKALELPLMAWEDVHETGGLYLDNEATVEKIGQAGPNRAQFAARFPNLMLPDQLGEAGWWNRPSEDEAQWPIRARRFLSDLTARHGSTNDRVAVISHGGFYRQALLGLLNAPPSDGYWFLLNNVGITRIDFSEGHVGLVYANRVDFLPRNLIT
jgi:2,3-bisphosphoglycerate-dependent phosphoglycerate mutase